jgi:hypothetical protein
MATLSPAILPVLILPYLPSVEWLYCHLLFVEWLLSPAFVDCLYFHTCYLLNGYIVVLQILTLSPAIRRVPILYLLSVERLYRHNPSWSSCRCGSRAVVKVISVTTIRGSTNLILCLRRPRYWKCWTTLCSCKERRSIIHESTKPLGASQIERCSAPAD